MIFLIYSETEAGTIAQNLGASEYSYYFVLKEYRPVLEGLGVVVAISDPENEADRIYRNAQARGEGCVFLSFAPPHKTYVPKQCPTIPVFAWEFDTLPTETWDANPRNDWRTVLRQTSQAITHSRFAVATVKAALGPDYPVISLPAPVWDNFASLYDPRKPKLREIDAGWRVEVRGRVFDTRALAPILATQEARAHPGPVWLLAAAGNRETFHDLPLDGVVYTAVFCPMDGRKNWFDMICAFCWALRDAPDATLVLKLTHRDCDAAISEILKTLAKLMPFQCRVVLIDGYLPDRDYVDLCAVSTYTVNTSHGEGQCLPLMEYMSAGKPAIAPAHSAMADYLDESNGFVISSHLEPTIWPHDPRLSFRTRRHRVDFNSVVAAYRDSYQVATHDPARYAAMARAAHDRLQAHCSRDVLRAGIVPFIARATETSTSDLALTA
jgi:glycosyltransferase involved in cell wall biosynthesis